MHDVIDDNVSFKSVEMGGGLEMQPVNFRREGGFQSVRSSGGHDPLYVRGISTFDVDLAENNSTL